MRIRGLRAMSELNGRVGTIVLFDGSKGRFRVRVDADACDVEGAAGKTSDKPRVLAFKADNLTPLKVDAEAMCNE